MKALWILLAGSMSIVAQSPGDDAVKYDSYSVLKRTVIPVVELEKAHPEEALEYVCLLATSHDPHAKKREKPKFGGVVPKPPIPGAGVDAELDVMEEIKPYEGPWITMSVRNALAINLIIEIAKKIDAIPYRSADGAITFFPKGERAEKGYSRIWPALRPKTTSSEQDAGCKRD